MYRIRSYASGPYTPAPNFVDDGVRTSVHGTGIPLAEPEQIISEIRERVNRLDYQTKYLAVRIHHEGWNVVEAVSNRRIYAHLGRTSGATLILFSWMHGILARTLLDDEKKEIGFLDDEKKIVSEETGGRYY